MREKAHRELSEIQVTEGSMFSLLVGLYNFRNKLKQKASQRHETEKDYMATMNAFGITTAEYSGDTALEVDTTQENEAPNSSDGLLDENVSNPYPFESSELHCDIGESIINDHFSIPHF